MDDWISVHDHMPPEGIVVETRIRDYKGERNRQKLKYSGGLWFLPDGSMYVYYNPTHWRIAL